MTKKGIEFDLRIIVDAVEWIRYADACGSHSALGEKILRVALDDIEHSERRKFGTILYAHVANQGCLGQVSAHAAEAIIAILRKRCYVDAASLYEVLIALMEGWGDEGEISGETGIYEPYWKKVRCVIYDNFDVYVRDIKELMPSQARPMVEFISWLAPRFPDVVDILRNRMNELDGVDRAIISSGLSDAIELISENEEEADERYLL